MYHASTQLRTENKLCYMLHACATLNSWAIHASVYTIPNNTFKFLTTQAYIYSALLVQSSNIRITKTQK